MIIDHFSCSWDGIVVKADGLAAGKGVIVCPSKEEAKEAARNMLQVKCYLLIKIN